MDVNLDDLDFVPDVRGRSESEVSEYTKKEF
jgi:hypothetical protein